MFLHWVITSHKTSIVSLKLTCLSAAAKYEVQADVDSDHDYEQLDDKLRTQDNFLFYWTSQRNNY